MQLIQVVDLSHHSLVRLRADRITGDSPPAKGDLILLKNKKNTVVGRILAPAKEMDLTATKDYSFERSLSKEESAAFRKINEGEEKPRILRAMKHARELGLEMNIFGSRCNLDQSLISFFYSAGVNIDFRGLLKLLQKEFDSQIYLQRTGPRDRAKIVGGFGVCGQETCCSTFKVDLQSIPLDAARDQNIPVKNNNRLLGLCGKLKCCLVYELPEYRRLRGSMPHMKQQIKDADGKSGKVIGLDILNQKAKIFFEDRTIEIMHVSALSW